MSNKAYYFGDANAIARLMKKMYFGVETEVPIYEEHEVTTTKQLSAANLGDFFDVTTNTPTTDPWTFADTGTAEVRMAGIKKSQTQYELTLTAKRALTGVAVDAEYYFSGRYGNISISIANTTVLSKPFSSEDKAKMNYWTGTLAAGDTIQIAGNLMFSSDSATPLVSVYVTCDGISITTTEQVQVGTETKELARKVIRAYQPDANGNAQLWFDADAAGTSVTFTGEHTVQDVTVDGVARKLYTLTGDGVLTVSKAVSFFMIGGGSSGEHAGRGAYNGSQSGRGGCGGKVASGTLDAGTWQVTIGKGGAQAIAGNPTFNAGTATTISDGTTAHSADGGTISAGGTGGGSAGSCYSGGRDLVNGGTGAGVSTVPFGLVDVLGTPGGAGGGGAVYDSNYGSYSGGDGGTNGGNGSNGVSNKYTPGKGGADGGGDGGSPSTTVYGKPATGKGSGGGGGAAYYPGSDARYGEGGAGADGAVWLLV